MERPTRVTITVEIDPGIANDYAVYLKRPLGYDQMKLGKEHGESMVRILQDANLIKPGFLRREYRI